MVSFTLLLLNPQEKSGSIYHGSGLYFKKLLKQKTGPRRSLRALLHEGSKGGSYVAFLLPALRTKMDVVRIGCVLHLCLELILSQERRKRRWWTHPAISNRLSTG
jgi:hypothetical protein